MTEEKKKAVAKAPAKKASAPKAAAKKPVATKKAKDPNAKTIRVVCTGSLIGTSIAQKNSMKGLGLRKIGASRELNDTPAIRGMIKIVSHLVRVEG